jgi:hypothetical protein
MAKITLTIEEKEEFFYNALCNGLDYCSYWGSFYWDSGTYQEVKTDLWIKAKVENPFTHDPICHEEVLMGIIQNGGTLCCTDENDELHEITLKTIHERMEDVPMRVLVDIIEEVDDATSADIVLQTVTLGGIIYG